MGPLVIWALLAVLGVEEENIFTDYELTSLSIWGERRRDSDWFRSLLAALAPFGDHASKALLNRQAEGYLRAIGVTAREIARLRKNLTEPAPAN